MGAVGGVVGANAVIWVQLSDGGLTTTYDQIALSTMKDLKPKTKGLRSKCLKNASSQLAFNLLVRGIAIWIITLSGHGLGW